MIAFDPDPPPSGLQLGDEQFFGKGQGGGGIEIVQRVDVDPCLWHRKDQICMPKSQLFDALHALFPQNELLMHQISTGYP